MDKVLQSYRYKLLVKRDRLFIMFSLFSFFIGQAVFFSFANPFYAPYLSLFLGESNLIFSIILIPAILGLMLCFKGIFLYTYITIGMLMFFINVYINYKKIKINNRVKTFFCSVSIILGGLIPFFSYNMSSYFLIYFLIFALITGTIAKLLLDGFLIISFKKNINNVKINELVGFSVLISAILIGVLNIEIPQFNLYLYFVLLLTFIVSSSAMKNNTLTFTFIITIIPFMLNKLNYNDLIVILLISFSTLVVFENDKKNIVLTTIPVLLISYLYINQDFFIRSNILAISISYLTFLLIPSQFYSNLQTKYGVVDNSFYPYAKKIKDFSNASLANCSRAFKNLSKIYLDLIKVNDVLTFDDYKNISKNVVEKVCLDCKCYNSCFVETKYTTDNTINRIIKAIDTNDQNLFNKNVFTFTKLCIKKDEFLKVLNIYYEFLKEQNALKNKEIDSKILMAEQLEEVSNVFLNIKEDLSNNLTFLPKFEKQILNSLSTYNIYPNKVIVLKKENNSLNIFIELDINLNEKKAFKTITSVCSTITNTKLKIIKTSLLESGNYEIYMEELKNFDINFGVSYKKKLENEVSGDTFSTTIFDNSMALLAISDGMGSGKEASVSSTMALNLYEEFLECGFDKNVAIKLINSSLILKNTKDSFATIDSAIIDLYKGTGEFIKIGAVQSFILRDKTVISISSKSLPIGIIKNIETKIYKKQLQHNDFIVLISDGVLDVISSYKNQEDWIKSVLKSYNGKSASDLADFIINEALKISENKIKDDMTVVVGKIVENTN